MNQIQKLLAANYLDQRTLADYLGVSPNSVCAWVGGRCNTKNKYLLKIKAHPTWDTSMIEVPGAELVTKITGDNNKAITSSGPVQVRETAADKPADYTAMVTRIAQLKAEVESLKARLKEKDNIIARQWEIITLSINKSNGAK